MHRGTARDKESDGNKGEQARPVSVTYVMSHVSPNPTDALRAGCLVWRLRAFFDVNFLLQTAVFILNCQDFEKIIECAKNEQVGCSVRVA